MFFFFLQEQNKCEAVQCLVLHDTILKHQAILFQLRSGLSILGFKKELEKAPAKFEVGAPWVKSATFQTIFGQLI